MHTPFQIAAGSVAGTEHSRALRANQDVWCVRACPQALVAVVADGCSGGAHTEVGARIGAALVAAALQREVVARLAALGPGATLDVEAALEAARCETLQALAPLAMAAGPDPATVVTDLFLFTVVGLLATDDILVVFALGDGMFAVNGEVCRLGPFADNAPPYLAYTLLAAPGAEDPANDFRITAALPTESVQSLLVGTDGVEHLIAAELECLPGRSELVGPISQFWREDRYFKNPDMVRRRLALTQNEHLAVDWRERVIHRAPGKFPDDTTLVALRRKPKR